MAVYKSKKEVPIPERAIVNKKSHRVYAYNDDSIPRKDAKQFVIGWATSDIMMQFNDNYILLFPEEYKRYVGGDGPIPPRSYVLKFGMYAMTLSAGYSCGLYKCLCDSFGNVAANGIMDFSMYSILMRSNVAMLFEDAMQNQVLFSDSPHDDSWFSRLFGSKEVSDNMEAFKQSWLDHWSEYCGTEIWIAIDGSNSDCDLEESELAAQGHAKSHNSGDIVAYMYVIDVATMITLTWDVYNGGIPDCKAFRTIAARLAPKGIKIKGALIDRGFCNSDVIAGVEAMGWSWVVMTTGGTSAHAEMMGKHAAEIRWRADKAIAPGIFGTTDKARLFKNDTKECTVGIFFDGANGSERSVRLMEKIFDAEEGVAEAVMEGKVPILDGSMKPYLSLNNVGGEWVVTRKYGKWQEELDEKGYSCIATNREETAKTIHLLYQCRTYNEKLYAVIGSMLGGGEARVHSDPSIEGKHLIIAVASIIRAVLMNSTSEKLRRKKAVATSKAIGELNMMEMLYSNGVYTVSKYPNARCKAILGRLGLKDDSLRALATEVTLRASDKVRPSEIRKMPQDKQEDDKGKNGSRPRGRWAAKLWAEKKKRELVAGGMPPEEAASIVKKLAAQRSRQEKKDKEEESKKVAAGSESTVTVGPETKTEASDASVNESAESNTEGRKDAPKRKPGRPKGSKNKKPAKSRKGQDGPKRGPGRPKGSKNKKTLEREKQEAKRAKRRAKNQGETPINEK